MQGFARPRLAVAAVAASAASLGGLALGAPMAHATGGQTLTVGPGGQYTTIGGAMSAAASGDTISVAAGTYNENVAVKAGVAVKAQSSQATVTAFTLNNATGATVDGFTVKDPSGVVGIKVSGGSNITISNNHVLGTGANLHPTPNPPSQFDKPTLAFGIVLNGTTSSLVVGNNADGGSDRGFMVMGGATGNLLKNNEASGNNNFDGNARVASGFSIVAPGNTLIGNIAHDNQETGIQVYPGGDNTTIADNVAYHNGNHGIDNLTVSGGKIANNTVFGNCASGINLEGGQIKPPGTGTDFGNYSIENNIAVDNGDKEPTACHLGQDHTGQPGQIRVGDDQATSNTVTVDHNLVFDSMSNATLYTWGPAQGYVWYNSLQSFQANVHQAAHDAYGNPQFVSASDAHLTAGSPAIGLGSSAAPGFQSTDHDGKTWSTTDAGAYAYNGGSTGGGGNQNGPGVARVAGNDRYLTAIAVSKRQFPTNGSAPAVILATGDRFPDALSGVPLAKAKGAPLLLTPSAGPDSRITAEIQRVLKPGGKVYVLGGTAAVPDTVVNALGLSNSQIVHLKGNDRFGTSLAIANELGNPKSVVVARGDDGLNQSGFADALSAGPYAADVFNGGGAAVLLTNNTSLDPAVRTYLQGATSIQAVGGPAATAVAGFSNALAPIKGNDRYDTAAQVAARFPTHYSTAGVAYGLKFPDALTGAALLANAGGPLLLTDSSSLPGYTQAQLNGVGQALGASGVIDVFGGTAVVTEAVRNAIASAAGGHLA